MSNREELIIFSIEKISQINRKLYRDMSKQNNLSPIQIQFIEYIYKAVPEKCTISNLAKEFELKKPTVSDSVKKLIEKGYLEKKSGENDKRSFYLVATKKCSKELGLIDEKNNILLKAIRSFPAMQKEQAVNFFMYLLKNLYDGGVIHNAGICLTCKNLSVIGKDGRKYHCNFLNKYFSDDEIKNNCMSYAAYKE